MSRPGRLEDGLSQWLQEADELNRRAVWVGDDALVVERTFAVRLGDDERDALGQPVRRRLVDADGSSAAACGTSSRLAEVPTEKKQTSRLLPSGLGGRFLHDQLPPPYGSRRPAERGGKRADVLESPLSEQRERDLADGAGGPDDADANVRHAAAPPARCRARMLSAEPGRRARHRLAARSMKILIGDVVTIWGSIPSSSSVAKAFAATPGWLLIRADDAHLAEIVTCRPGNAEFSSAASASVPSASAAEKTISLPVCTTVSTLIPASASAWKSVAAEMSSTSVDTFFDRVRDAGDQRFLEHPFILLPNPRAARVREARPHVKLDVMTARQLDRAQLQHLAPPPAASSSISS